MPNISCVREKKPRPHPPCSLLCSLLCRVNGRKVLFQVPSAFEPLPEVVLGTGWDIGAGSRHLSDGRGSCESRRGITERARTGGGGLKWVSWVYFCVKHDAAQTPTYFDTHGRQQTSHIVVRFGGVTVLSRHGTTRVKPFMHPTKHFQHPRHLARDNPK